MPVDSKHPAYEHMLPKWERVRDSVAGEDAIKARGSTYLPVPPGIDQPWGEKDPAYLNYLRRATYPEIMAPTIQGMVGLMGRKDTEITVPQALERLNQLATPDGLDLQGLLTRLRHEVLALGRYVLFVDAPEDGGDPMIATYAAESLINWQSDGERLTRAVFAEHAKEIDPADPFVEQMVPQWREAAIDAQVNDEGEPTGGERYIVRVWRKYTDADGNEQFYVYEQFEPQGRGKMMDRVPAVIVGSRDLLPDPDQVPLLGVVNRCLDYYRQSADYKLGLFMSTQATPYGTGINPDEKPTMVGPSTFWAAQSESARFGYAEIEGNGLSAQQQSLTDTKSEIMDAAMRVLGDGRRGAEAAEALRLRFQSQTATLATIAQSTATGLGEALEILAQWDGANADQVSVEPNLDFIHETADPQVLTALMDSLERGITPDTLFYQYLRRTNLTDLDDDEIRQLSPAAQSLPSGDDEG